MPALPLRGRAGEMHTLTGLLETLAGGRAATVVIEGSPGIGKSRLLGEVARIASDDSMLVAAGRADEVEAIAPLSSLLSALSAGDPPVLRRDELLALERPGDQRFWLLEELAELLEVRSREVPIVVALDDVQWAEPVTLGAVQVLTQRLRSSPVGWIVALRPHSTQPGVTTLVRALTESGATLLQLGPLQRGDMEAMAADILGGVPDPELGRFLVGVGGNPFLGIDLLRALHADGAIRVDDGVASLTEAQVPDQFRASVRGRLTTLSSDARHFLQAGSVFGRSFGISDVAAMLGTWPSALVPVVDETVRGNVLGDVGGRLEFCHDLIRQAITQDMTDSTRLALHRGAAAAILARGGPATEASVHLLASAEPGDQEAALVLRRAAADVAGQAPRTAADLAWRAIEIMSPGQPGWTEALVAAVGLAAWASRFADAIAIAQRALATGLDPEAEATVRLGLADALMLGGRRRDAIVECRIALARGDMPRRLRCRFLHNLGFALAMDGEVSAAGEAYTTAVETAESDDTPLLLACQIGLAFLTGSRGRLSDALAMGEQCMQMAEAGGPEERQRFPQAWYGRALSVMDRVDDVDNVFAAYRREAEELGAAWALEFCQRAVCVQRMTVGRLDDAATEAEANLALIDALDMWHDSDVPFGVLTLVAIHRNDLEGARGQLGHASRYEPVYARALPPYLAWAKAMLLDAEGDQVGAVAELAEIFDLGELRTQNIALEPTLAPVLVRLALKADDTRRAEMVTETAVQLARQNPEVASVVAAAAHCRGLQAGSAAQLMEAAQLFETSPRVIPRASACEDAGRAAVGSGARESGVTLLDQALTLYREVGAVRDESRVQRRLREAGVRPRSRRSTTAVRAALGWDSLTPAELRVVRLVAQGLTNRQVAERLFLSTYTVGTHLKHAFDKLGVTSRVELTRLAVERQVSI